MYSFSSTLRISFQSNEGNDNLTLLKLLNNNDPVQLTRPDKESHLEPSQHKYMHNDIQNEFIELMVKQVLAKKLKSIRSSKFFGIIADEYTYISNKELLSRRFQWIKDLRVHEGFVG